MFYILKSVPFVYVKNETPFLNIHKSTTDNFNFLSNFSIMKED